jgi:putative FmdB family regulatory protein
VDEPAALDEVRAGWVAMPFYDQRCPKCGHEFEVRRGIRDTTPVACTKCGATTKRLISLSSFHLKGPGWASDGYKGRK